MVEYPVEIRRCQHIKVNGAQCGSPALKGKKLCFFHNRSRPVTIKVTEGWRNGEILLPAFEDASSIQFTVRQVAQMLLEQKIGHKTAGLLLYALQLAVTNLKQMDAEKPRPTQMVLDPKKVGETPLGMTPWSASGEGHDPEDVEDMETIEQLKRVNGEWVTAYWQTKEWLVKRTADLRRWLEAAGNPSQEQLLEAMTSFKGSLEREVGVMEKGLKEVRVLEKGAEGEGWVV
jgi:hypothetical protein